MRHSPLPPVLGLLMVLSGCGGSNTVSTSTPSAPVVAPTYSIGGTISGLSGTVVLKDNGTDTLTLSSNGAFTFDVTLQPKATYDVTIATQPANQTCTVSNATGTATTPVTNVTVVCSLSSTASNVWTWMSGSSSANAVGVYGTMGTAAATSTPGARRQAESWTDASGNFWLFGGQSMSSVSVFADLWEFSPSSGQWVWQGGPATPGAAASYGSQGVAAAGNTPGSREGAARWTDSAGNLWLFGGDTLSGQTSQVFSDLWMYQPATGLWTWMGGSNTASSAGSYGTQGVPAAGNLPPARTGAATWVDSAGVFWLFGGVNLNSSGDYIAVYGDLWSYNPSSAVWTWVGGSSQVNAAGVYGTQGIAAAGNIPGARTGSTTWVDGSGNVWLFGGLGLGAGGVAQEYSDLWEYVPASGQWTWISGASVGNSNGVYGSQGAAAPGNSPGARSSAVGWIDSSGRLWLFGGHGYDRLGNIGELNDLWEYDSGVGAWTWIGGSMAVGASANYGSKGVSAAGSAPGAREQASGWLDGAGNFWLFGGFGIDASGEQGDLNDLWRFAQSP